MSGYSILFIILGLIAIVALISTIIAYIYLPTDATSTIKNTLYVNMVTNGIIILISAIGIFVTWTPSVTVTVPATSSTNPFVTTKTVKAT